MLVPKLDWNCDAVPSTTISESRAVITTWNPFDVRYESKESYAAVGRNSLLACWGEMKCRYIGEAGLDTCMTSVSRAPRFLRGMASVTRTLRSVGAVPSSLYPCRGGADGEADAAWGEAWSELAAGKARRKITAIARARPQAVLRQSYT